MHKKKGHKENIKLEFQREGDFGSGRVQIKLGWSSRINKISIWANFLKWTLKAERQRLTRFFPKFGQLPD